MQPLQSAAAGVASGSLRGGGRVGVAEGGATGGDTHQGIFLLQRYGRVHHPAVQQVQHRKRCLCDKEESAVRTAAGGTGPSSACSRSGGRCRKQQLGMLPSRSWHRGSGTRNGLESGQDSPG
jgi:hypothetical protein